MTKGQNTIVLNGQNQKVDATPTINYASSGTTQGSSTVVDIPDDSTAFWIADLTSAYFDVYVLLSCPCLVDCLLMTDCPCSTSYSRGVRLLNKRRQVLIQDEMCILMTFDWIHFSE